MTAHATITQLAEREAWSDLAEAAAPDAPTVTGDALRRRVAPPVGEVVLESPGTVLLLDRAVGRLTAVLADASAEVDGYLAGRTAGAAVLRTRTLDIAAYRLLGGETESERYQIWRRAVEWLSAVASGRIALPSADAGATGGGARIDEGGPALFRRSDLRGL